MDSKYWSNRISRRTALRGGVVAGAGLMGAALIGCGGETAMAPTASTGGSSAPTAAPSGGSTAAAAAGAAPVADRPGMPSVKGAPKKGGTWTSPVTDTYVTHDQHTAVSNSEWQIIGERAMERDEWTGELRPNLVEAWEIPDKDTYILKVRKGVKMHPRAPWNGREFDAEDLAWNLNRIAGNTGDAENIPRTRFQRRSTMDGTKSFEVVDKYTVKITMEKPNSAFLEGITEIRNLMMPREMVDIGFDDPMKFGGMSPFQITEFKPGVRQSYERVDGYYRPDEPHIDKIVQTVVPDRAALLAGFISKQFSHMSAPTAQEQKTILAAHKDALLYSYVGVNYQFLMLNFQHKPFQDIRVRKALNLTANREEIGNGYHGSGWGWLAAIHPAFAEAWSEDKVKSLPGWNVATKAKDLEEAAKLMAAAGFDQGAGLEFEMMHKPKADNRENALRYQAQLAKQFPKAKVKIVAPETAVFNKAQSSKDFISIANDSTMQPAAALEATARWHSDGSRNYGAFKNADADALLEKALAEGDPKARAEILNQFQQKWVDEWLPHIQFYATPVRHFVQPNFAGFDKLLGPWDSGRGMTFKLGRIYQV